MLSVSSGPELTALAKSSSPRDAIVAICQPPRGVCIGSLVLMR